MNSNIYMNIIFIGVRAKINAYMVKYLKTLFILPKHRNFSTFTMHYLSSFFSV